jgi:hypothetical protein
LGKFVALLPVRPPAELAALAEACVLGLNDLQAPLSPEDLERRQISKLDARELELLRCYGYPYVLERFRFHFSLTGSTDHPTRQRVIQVLTEPVTQLNSVVPMMLDRLCLFRESASGHAFKRIADVALST